MHTVRHWSVHVDDVSWLRDTFILQNPASGQLRDLAAKTRVITECLDYFSVWDKGASSCHASDNVQGLTTAIAAHSIRQYCNTPPPVIIDILYRPLY